MFSYFSDCLYHECNKNLAQIEARNRYRESRSVEFQPELGVHSGNVPLCLKKKPLLYWVS